MKKILKTILGKSYLFFIEKINILAEEYKIDRLKSKFKGVGKNFQIKLPFYITSPKHITIGDNFYAWYNCRIEAIDRFNEQIFNPIINIGNNVIINTDCHIGCINQVVIGDNVLIGSKVCITDHSHGELEEVDIPPFQRNLISKGPVILEKNIWVGENVVILPNVKIGENCIIGAGSVVTKSFPKNCLIVGNPAKIIKLL